MPTVRCVLLAWGRHLLLKQVSDTDRAHPLPTPRALAHGYTAHGSGFEKQRVFESFLPFLHASPLDLLYEMCGHATWQEERQVWGKLVIPRGPFHGDLGPTDQATDRGHPLDSVSSLPTLTSFLPGASYSCM